ncbi:MAG: glyceraldehyde-3-phosphate dehydrogenase, partial [Pseudomonadales bacterium]|nr:glyceraldehyde-3-phosphate dehydrogenase [Pseudomonadales bacterium]
DLGAASSVSNLGGGFRYLVAERYGFWMGADVARGPEESAFYIQAGSSW